MTDSHRLDRKNFLKLSISVAGAGASAWLVGCSDAEDPEATGGAAGTTAGTNATGGRAGAGMGGGGAGGTTAGTGTAGTTAGTGTAGTTAGTGGKAGSAGSAGSSSGVGGGGTSAGGSAGTGGSAGGTGGSAGGTGGGTSGTGGALGGAGSGGKGGGGKGGTGGGGGSCAPVSWSQNASCQPSCSPHTHVPTGAALTQFLDELAAHITGPDALMPLRVPMDGAQSPSGIHGHFITFTQPEITTLLGGGSVTNKTKDEDEIDDNHVWTISCG